MVDGQVTVEYDGDAVTVFDGGLKVAVIRGATTQCADLADYLRKRI